MHSSLDAHLYEINYKCYLWEREIGTLASSLVMGLGYVLKIILMTIYDSGKFLPANVLV
jgi:hypothetical protein